LGTAIFSVWRCRHPPATFTRAVVSAVLPRPAAPQSAAPAAPLGRWTRSTAPAAAPANSRVSGALPKPPRSRAALSYAGGSAAPTAAASRSGSDPATPRPSPPAAPPPVLSKSSPSYLVFLPEITLFAAPHRHILAVSFFCALCVLSALCANSFSSTLPSFLH
jgi:hypothetical protein